MSCKNFESKMKLRAQVLDFYSKGLDWKSLINNEEVSLCTAYRWIRNIDATIKKPGGKTYQKFNSEHLQFIDDLVAENPRLTLQQIKEKLYQKFQFKTCNESIRTKLDGLLYTVKDIRLEPQAANSTDNKEKRKFFVEKISTYLKEGYPIIYMDETNFNMYISRRKGRSLKGSRCTYVSANSGGANLHLIGCISNSGFLHYELKMGSFRNNNANEFIEKCLEKAEEVYRRPVVLVIDNAPCHSKAEEVTNNPKYSQHKILRLGPYSPMLNPIEFVWSVLKSKVKKDLAELLPQILRNELNIDLSQKAYRMKCLSEIVVNSIGCIGFEKCTMFYSKVTGLYPEILALKDVDF